MKSTRLLITGFCIIFILLGAGSKNAQTKTTWSFATKGAVYSSPACENGSVFIGSDDNNLYCLKNTTGELNWKFAAKGIIRCKPAVSDGNIFFTSDDGFLYALDSKSGLPLWNCFIGKKTRRLLPDLTTSTGEYWDYMQSSPVLKNGTLFVGSGDSCLYAVNAQTGTIKWRAKTNGIVRSTPFVDNGIVYAGSFDGCIYAFDEKKGTKIWSFDTSGKQYHHVQCSPVIKDGILYCGGRNPFFYALDSKTGKEIWKFNYDFSWVESSAIVVDGIVYVGSSDLKIIYAFDAKNGNVKWSSKVNGDTWSTPFYKNGIIYIGVASYKEKTDEPAGGGILALDASTGKSIFEISCGVTPYIGGVVSSPIVEQNWIYYGSLDGKVYAIKIAE